RQRVAERRAGRLRGAAGDGREGEALALEGADVDARAPDVAALVGGAGLRGIALADGGAAGQQGHGLGRPAVVAQRRQQRVPADQVVAARNAAEIEKVREVTAEGLPGDDRVVQRYRAQVVEQAAPGAGAVAADGAARQGEGAGEPDGQAAARGVAASRGVAEE